MMRSMIAMSVACLAASASGLAAQSLASRVDQAPDGLVRMQLPARPGTCGDGRELVGYGSAIFGRNFQSIGGRWRSDTCVAGPLRVTLRKTNGVLSSLRTQVGGQWPRTDERATDLGEVPATDASAYFLSLVPQLERAEGKDRLLIPAVLADVPPPVQPLFALARDGNRAIDTRRAAVQWLGLLGDAAVVPALARMAREDADADEGRPTSRRGLRGAALAALSMIDDGAGVPALIDLARSGSEAVRHDAVFWLGQSGDDRGRRALHSVIEDGNEAVRVRSHAVFSLAHGGDVPPGEFAWLRSAFPRLHGEKVRESVMHAMSQDEEEAGGRWLIERALDASESLTIRKSALFWAGQRRQTPAAELARAYRDATDNGLKEHAIFVLSQRKDEAAAVEALMRIARGDPDTRMRGKALFWLAQMDDPRVRTMIADIVLK